MNVLGVFCCFSSVIVSFLEINPQINEDFQSGSICDVTSLTTKSHSNETFLNEIISPIGKYQRQKSSNLSTVTNSFGNP